MLELRLYEHFHYKLLVSKFNKSVIKNVLKAETWQSNLKKRKKEKLWLVIFKSHKYKKIKVGLSEAFPLQIVLKAHDFNYIENWSSDGSTHSQSIWGGLKKKVKIMKLFKFHLEAFRCAF